MGKAALDLPDPLQTPPDEGKPLTSTDDLLARLAGEEIDRLLAEVDDQAPVAGPLALPPRTAGAPHEPKAGDPPPAPAAQSSTPTFEPGEETTPTDLAAAAEPDLTAELDAFFKSAIPAPAAARSVAADASVAEPTAAPAHAVAAPLADLIETSTEERQGLRLPPSAEEAAPTKSAAATDAAEDVDVGVDPADADEAAGALPFYLRPLEWINAPLEACPPWLRDFIGKVAIITLVNAAAVLLYVMLFRRR